MLEKIVQIESIGRFRNYCNIPEATLPWFLSGKIRIKDAEMFIRRLVQCPPYGGKS